MRWCRQLAQVLRRARRPPAHVSVEADARSAHRAGRVDARVGMTVRVDAIGNIRGVHPGDCRQARAPRHGLHRLASRHGTQRRCIRGVLGVVLAVALVELLGETPIAVCDRGRRIFRRGRGALRRPVSRQPRAGRHVRRRCSIAKTPRAARARSNPASGLDHRIPDAQAPPDALGYLEFPIEQGPVLENLKLPLAVVDGSRVRAAPT